MDRKRIDRNILFVIGVIWAAAILFGMFVFKKQGLWIDYAILDLIHLREMPWLSRIMEWITKTGDPLFYVVFNLLAILWLAKKKRYPELICLVGAVLIGWGLNQGMKHIFLRARPDGYALIDQGGYSYPSGHAMVAASWYPVLGYLLQYRRESLRAAGAAVALYGLLPGLSRLFLGVHYPTDVFFGHWLGLTIAYLCVCAYAEYKRRHHLRA